MVAQLLRLRLSLARNVFRRRPIQVFAVTVGLLYTSGLTVLATIGVLSLRDQTPDIARAVMVVGGTLVVLGFILLPLAFGADDPLDPRRFSLFGIPQGRLARSIAVTSAASIPGLVIGIIATAQVVAWSRDPFTVFMAALSALVIIPTCLLVGRFSAGIASLFLSSRRARDATGTTLALLLAIAAPLAAYLATLDWDSQGLPIMRRIAAVASWTPLGAPWSVAGDVALGRSDTAGQKLAISIAFVIVMWTAWRLLIAAMLVKPERVVTARTYSGLGWFGRLPATPLGAVAARSLSYWGRDRRYQVPLAVIPLVPIVMVAAMVVAGVPTLAIALIPVPTMCLFIGWSVHNDIAHDSTAFWAHVSASTRGSDDRWGRVIPPLFIGIPVAIIGSVITVLVVADGDLLPGLIGLSVGMLLAALGISSLVSAAFPYPAVRPGDSPFAQPQAIGSNGSTVQAVSLLVALVLSAPVVIVIVMFPALQYEALVIGIGTGLVVLLAGVLWGGRIVGRRAPELLAFTLRN